MISCEATGPMNSVCVPPASVLNVSGPARLCTTPWETRNSAPMTEIGSRM